MRTKRSQNDTEEGEMEIKTEGVIISNNKRPKEIEEKNKQGIHVPPWHGYNYQDVDCSHCSISLAPLQSLPDGEQEFASSSVKT